MSDHVELEGDIVNSTKGIFKVKPILDDGTYMKNQEGKDVLILCNISGKLRKNKIQLLLGDRVRFKVSPYDMTRGFITYRLRQPRSEQY